MRILNGGDGSAKQWVPPGAMGSPTEKTVSLSKLFSALASGELSPFFGGRIVSGRGTLGTPLYMPAFVPLVGVSTA